MKKIKLKDFNYLTNSFANVELVAKDNSKVDYYDIVLSNEKLFKKLQKCNVIDIDTETYDAIVMTYTILLICVDYETFD
jgi:hypothetical protein